MHRSISRNFTDASGQREAGWMMKALAAVLTMLNIGRVFLVPVTCDEAPSRADLGLGYMDYLTLSKVTANIHILNSVLRKACLDLLGTNQLALRLPNLLAGILFLFATFQLSRTLFRKGPWQLFAFVALNLNPFLFEFWGLSRGYGLAIAFMMTSLLFLLRFLDGNRQLHLALSLLFGILAVYSNFALLNFFISIVALVFITQVRKPGFRVSLFWLALASGIAALSLIPIQKLRLANELYYGGSRGLFHDTISSLVQYSLHVENPAEPIILFVAAACSLSAVAMAAYWNFRGLREGIRSHTVRTGITLLALLAIPLLALEVQHAIFGTRYLIDRTALFLSPLFWINIAYWIYTLREKFPKAVPVLAVAIAAGIAFNFVQHTTLRKSQMWAVDNNNQLALKRMLGLRPETERRISLRAWWGTVPSLSWYGFTQYDGRFTELPFSQQALQASDTAYDFIYMPVSDTAGISPGYRLDTVYDELNCLFERKPGLQR